MFIYPDGNAIIFLMKIKNTKEDLMIIQLAQNIKSNRKRLNLTQENLAEVLNVTVGAVHKWETGLSTPELSLIIKMADFFDLSVDVLLGYEMQNNNLKNTVEKLKTAVYSKDFSEPEQVEMAVKKYPHSFDVFFYGATLLIAEGAETNDRNTITHSIELFEKALLLLPQNTDPSISEFTIKKSMSDAYLLIGNHTTALKFLRESNPQGVNNADIGLVLSLYSKEYDEAEMMLSYALLSNLSEVLKICMSYYNLYVQKGKIGKAREIMNFQKEYFKNFKLPNTLNFADKNIILADVMISYTYMKENEEKCRSILTSAVKSAKEYDAESDSNANNLNFININHPIHPTDNRGKTAREAITSIVNNINNRNFTKLYESLNN